MPNKETGPSTAPDSDLSFADLFVLMYRGKLWIIIFSILGGVAGYTYGHLQPNVYRADTLLSVIERSSSSNLSDLTGQLGGLAGAIGFTSSGSDKDESLAVLRSRAFIIGFVTRRQLKPELFADRYLTDSNSWDPELGGEPTNNETYEYIVNEIIGIREDAKSGLVTTSVFWTDPAIAADWANALITDLNSQRRDTARDRARESIDYLESEIKATVNTETQRTLYGLMGNHVNEIVLANVTKEFAFKVIDPAVAPDSDDVVRPRKVFLLAAGLVLGFMAAIVLIVGQRLWAVGKEVLK